MRRELLIALVVIMLLTGASVPMLMELMFRSSGESLTQPSSYSTVGAEVFVSNYSWPTALPGGDLITFKSYRTLVNYLSNISKLNQLLNVLGGVRVITPLFATIPTMTPMPSPAPTTATSLVTQYELTKAPVVRVPGTNVQVIGIDEPDIVKCNGRLIVVASGSRVFVVGVPEKSVLNVLTFNEPINGLFLVNNSLVVITTSSPQYQPIRVMPDPQCVECVFVIPPGTSNATVHIYDVSNPKKPVVKGVVSLTGSIVSSRLNGDHLYLITSLPTEGPSIPIVNGVAIPPESIVAVDANPTTYTSILALNIGSLNYSVHTFMTGYNSWLYMSPVNLYLVASQRPTLLNAYITVIKSIAKYLPTDLGSEIGKYLSSGDVSKSLELIADSLNSLSLDRVNELFSKVSSELSNAVFTESSKFYVFGVEGVKVSFRGLFEVNGTVLDQFSMEELGEYFIVATTSTNWSIKVYYEVPTITIMPTPKEEVVKVIECRDNECIEKSITITPTTTATPVKPRFHVGVVPLGVSENNVFTIKLSDLRIAGSLTGLAEGERIYAARLIRNTLYLVTFRQVDPLFAIDLSNPANPKVLGYLKTPGFSEYLHPLPDYMLLGIGIEEGMLKVSLFNISDPTKMSETSKVKLAATSPALQDHHAVALDLDSKLVFIPVKAKSGSGVIVLSFKDGSLSLRKFLEHLNALRTTYVDDELYTISTSSIKVFNISDLSQLSEIQLS